MVKPEIAVRFVGLREADVETGVSCSMRECCSIVSMLSVPPPFMRPRDAKLIELSRSVAVISWRCSRLSICVPHPASDGDRVFLLGIVVLFLARLCLSTASDGSCSQQRLVPVTALSTESDWDE